MRPMFLSGSSLSRPVFAKADDNAAKEKETDKVIDKAVYITPDKSLKSVVAHVGNAADASLRMVAAMCVHLVVRTYTPVLKDRSTFKDIQAEIMGALKEYAQAKRGKDFGRAWVYRFLSLSVKQVRSMMTDYDRKGVQDGSPLQHVLRAKDAEKAGEIVMEYITLKTKGVNNFSTLEKALTGKPAANRQDDTKRGGNAVKPSADTAPRIAKALTGDRANDIVKAIPGNAKAKAIKLADKTMGETAVLDREAFVIRAIALMTDSKALIRIAHAATERAKELAKAVADTKAKRTKLHREHDATNARHANEPEAAAG